MTSVRRDRPVAPDKLVIQVEHRERTALTRRSSIQPPSETAAEIKEERGPNVEVLKKRLLREGGRDLTEEEILELALSFVMPRREVKRVGRSLLLRFKGLAEVLSASVVELTGSPGVPEQAAAFLRLMGEIAHRLSDTIPPPAKLLEHPQELERYLLSRMKGMKEENILLIFLDEQGVILGEELMGTGTVDQVVIFPRKIIEAALRFNASSLLIVHNHPHGPPLPTAEDQDEARRLREILLPFDILVRDSLVVGRSRCFSIFKNGSL